MASLQERNGSYRILFFYQGKLHSFTLGQVNKDEAESKAAQVDYLLMRLKQHLLTLPEGTDVVTFVQHDGKPPESKPRPASRTRQAVTLGHLKDRYLATHGNGTIEANSLDTCKLHLNHFCQILGAGLPLAELTHARLQDYVTARTDKKLSPTTIRKEMATLRAVWNWGEPMGLTAGSFPCRGLRYPKTLEKPPFMTYAEIERRIAAGGEPSVLWESLYLTIPELTELLAHVKEKAAHPWIYPLCCFAVHSGARRSEIQRALVADVDLGANSVTIQEKKRSKGQRTTRRVPLTPFLAGVLRDWLDVHPGGPFLFCHAETVARSKKRSRTTGHPNATTRPKTLPGRLATVRVRERPALSALSRNEVHDHVGRTLAGSRWEVVRGLHTLRHSFISACASKGVDQRLVQEWAGHMNEATSRRYRHLWPSTQQKAIKRVFS